VNESFVTVSTAIEAVGVTLISGKNYLKSIYQNSNFTLFENYINGKYIQHKLHNI